jgi:hypothetical protein
MSGSLCYGISYDSQPCFSQTSAAESAAAVKPDQNNERREPQ